MSPVVFIVGGRILLLLAATAQLVSAAPADWSSKEYIGSPQSVEEYLTLREPFVEREDKRAPWAPSVSRSDTFSQKIRELISERNKGKRGKQSSETVDLSPADVVDLLRFRQIGLPGLDYEAIDFALKAALSERDRSGTAQRNELGKSEGKAVQVKDGGPVSDQLDGPGGFKQPPKRSGSPFNLGLGQHAASAAMSAYEHILDESKNYRPDRPSSPVRFLGRR